MPRILNIADAIVAEINSSKTFAPYARATRAYVPEFELKNVSGLMITVVPRSMECEAADRSRGEYTVEVDIAVQQKVTTDAEKDIAMELVEQIEAFFRLKRLEFAPQACWQRSANAPIYSVAHLKEAGVFTSVLTLTYAVVE